MAHKHADLYGRYFTAVVGRHYPAPQRERILDLIATAFGVAEGSEELETLHTTINTLEEHEINDVNDCKNYLLVCEIMGEDDEAEAAVTALIDVFGDFERDKRPTYTSHLEWILEMRSAIPRTDALRMENALLEYSTGDIASAVSELKILVNGGDFPALVYLAEISAAEESFEAAYQYLLLMKRTYEKEIEIPAFEALSERIALARAAIGREKAAEIEAAVAALPPFLTADGQTGGIGFGQKTTGKRYTYEH